MEIKSWAAFSAYIDEKTEKITLNTYYMPQSVPEADYSNVNKGKPLFLGMTPYSLRPVEWDRVAHVSVQKQVSDTTREIGGLGYYLFIYLF